MYCIPFVGGCMSFFYLCGATQAVHAKIAPVGTIPINPLLAAFCMGLVLQQVRTEIDCRKAAGQPIIQNQPVSMMPGMPMTAAPGTITMHPVAANKVPDALSTWFTDAGVPEAEAPMRAAGVSTLDDLKFIDDETTKNFNISAVAKNKLRAALDKLPKK